MNPAYHQTRFRTSRLDPPPAFAIVTAHNPDGKTSSPAENAILDAQLLALLEIEALETFPVTGGSPDFSHAEDGYGIATTLDRALELGRRFHQEAIYWIDSGRLFLVDCTTEASVPLGPWAARCAPPD